MDNNNNYLLCPKQKKKLKLRIILLLKKNKRMIPVSLEEIKYFMDNNNMKLIPAKNDVINGIKFTMSCLENDKIMINDCCKSIISEFSLYSWNDKSADDRPIKKNDHALDDMRYFCYTVLNQNRAAVFDRHKIGIF